MLLQCFFFLPKESSRWHLSLFSVSVLRCKHSRECRLQSRIFCPFYSVLLFFFFFCGCQAQCTRGIVLSRFNFYVLFSIPFLSSPSFPLYGSTLFFFHCCFALNYFFLLLNVVSACFLFWSLRSSLWLLDTFALSAVADSLSGLRPPCCRKVLSGMGAGHHACVAGRPRIQREQRV